MTTQKEKDLHCKNVTELKELAEQLGIKKSGVGWEICCPPDGNKSAIISAIVRSSCFQELEHQTLDDLRQVAIDLGIKKSGVSWEKCCPPDGNKPAILSAIANHQELDQKNVEDLKQMAIDLGIKKTGVGWDKCCPPNGNKSAIMAAILGAKDGTAGALATPMKDSKPATECEGMTPAKGKKTDAVDGLPPCLIAVLEKQMTTSELDSLRAAPCMEKIQKMTLAEVRDLATSLKVKVDKIGWSTCCPPDGNKAATACAVTAAKRAAELAAMTVDNDLKPLAIKLGIKKDGTGWDQCCPPAGDKCSLIVAILRREEHV